MSAIGGRLCSECDPRDGTKRLITMGPGKAHECVACAAIFIPSERQLTNWYLYDHENDPDPEYVAKGMCGARIDCGGSCHLALDHQGAHLCAGDGDEPGSCPA
jgi:hypothetical protein